ncbi:MAG TPA: OsmC family protein [Candidatus Methylomirabilis sp.]|nr:OsmC family protein [Candidatus Methylomirabilis sp.]
MTATTTPPIVLDLTWQGGMRFAAQSEKAEFVLDGPGSTIPTPVQALAGCLAACMGIDIVQILSKGRHDLKTLRAHLVGDRRGEDPKHFTRIRVHFTLTGDVPRETVERAIALSRETYCSVWHSLRRDIDFQTTFEVHT